MGRFSGATGAAWIGVFNGFTEPSFDPFFTGVFFIFVISLALLFCPLGLRLVEMQRACQTGGWRAITVSG